MSHRFRAWLVVALLLVTGPVGGAETVAAGALRLAVDPAGAITASAAGDPRLLRSAALHVYDGATKAAVALTPTGVKRAGEAVEAGYRGAAGLTIALSLRPMGRCVVWAITCRNGGPAERRLEVGPTLRLTRARVEHYCDGWDEFDAPASERSSTKLEGNFPLPGVWNKAAAVAVGLEPSALVSYLRHDYRPAGDDAWLAAVTRLAVRPGESVTVPFVTCAAPGEWGWYELLEAYYDSFPSWFVARDDVDPRATAGSAQYRAWPAGPWSREISRRLYGGWEWCYAPFRRTGDIVGRAELWDYQPVRPFGAPRGKPREEYLAWRRHAFAQGERGAGVAMMFYIPSQVWCEQRLATERYPDALTTDPKAKILFDTPWVTGHDDELRVFPYQTSFGEATYRDLGEVAEQLDLSGFAFDTAGDAVRYLGPALGKLDCRAWDDQVGVYCAESVAIARLMDYVHTLRKDGRTLAVVSNPMANGTYASCFRSDSAMLERNPWSHTRTESDRLRWKMGHKTLVWWEGYEVNDFIDPAHIRPEQLAGVYQGLADFTLLQSLRVGYIPTPNFTQGVARLVRWLPLIVECVRTGWQPVPAARVPPPLWSARYGRGLATILAVAHETGEPVDGEVAVENARLGDGAFLFSGHDGRAVSQRLAGGETRCALSVPVRTPVVLRAWLNVRPAAAVAAATVSAADGATAATLTAALTGRGETALTPRVPPGMRLDWARWNGAAVPLVPGEPPEVKITLAGAGRLECRFVSRTLKLTDEQLFDYPFVAAGAPGCAIVLEAADPESLRPTALSLQEYFRYWFGRAAQPAAEVLVPIVTSPSAAPRQVRLRLAAGASPTAALAGDDLVLEAGDAAALDDLVQALLRVLDRRYWTPDQFPGVAVREALARYDPEG